MSPGADPQDGACEVHYHGSTTGGGAAPESVITDVIEAGDQRVWLLSGEAPEFQGYVIAACDFQYGHGYAFISDGFLGLQTLAQGYLALILDVDEDSLRALTDGAEILEH